MHHFRKSLKAYESHRQADRSKPDCTLCPDRNVGKVLYQGNTMYVLKNRVMYDMFDGRRVEDHLLVMPLLHKSRTADFTDEEQLELLAIVGEYEAKGYNFYGRGVDSPTRSVKHQHTHLIKLAAKKPRYIIAVSKPYIVLSK